MTSPIHHPASFRDPSGFVFEENGMVYRKVGPGYADSYKKLMGSGLYDLLTQKRWMVSHAEIKGPAGSATESDIILLPEQIPFISYPYEWSFDMLKDAALLTLEINKQAMLHGMILKDATAFNVQFLEGKPIFIDTLSFTVYDEAKPWIAYRQFCEHFLFPLFLDHYLHINAQNLLAVYPGGIPLSMAASLLSGKGRFNLGIWLHLRLQNKVSAKTRTSPANSRFSKNKLLRILGHLDIIIRKLTGGRQHSSAWNAYYDDGIISADYFREKELLLRSFLENIPFTSALDIGTNNGRFAELLAEKAVSVIAIDADPQCVNQLYRSVAGKHITNLLPLCVDITHPPPGIGFNNRERTPFLDRISPDLVAALALIHHLVLTQNIPLPDLAAFFARCSKGFLIIEFVPLTDQRAKDMVVSKEVYHTPYNEAAFEHYFGEAFQVERKNIIPGSGRTLYLLRRR